ncbi:hypothetical protein FHU30_001118 [Actinomadura rupiterrae]|nr:AAA family ATPase [Actinomadura rupiterrae]MCP2335788.1 hypothetical protein [Actinomadura rupiterrae]
MTTWDEVVAMEMAEQYVIEGLVSAHSTLLAGEPKAGKSLITAGLLRSLFTGEPFLGRRVNPSLDGQPYRVALCWTDDAARQEYRDRLLAVLPPGAKPDLRFFEIRGAMREEDWPPLARQIREAGCNFLVFDVMSQALDGSLNDDHVVSMFFRGVREFARQGIPVLVLTHTSDKSGPNGWRPTAPMGSTLISAAVRTRLMLTRSAGGIWTVRVTGSTTGLSEIQFSAVRHDVPAFTVVASMTVEERRDAAVSRSRKRSGERLDRDEKLAQYIVQHCQGMTRAEAAGVLFRANPGGRKESTLRKELSGGTLSRILSFDPADKSWSLAGPLEV